jgi:hypothetical protein
MDVCFEMGIFLSSLCALLPLSLQGAVTLAFFLSFFLSFFRHGGLERSFLWD